MWRCGFVESLFRLQSCDHDRGGLTHTGVFSFHYWLNASEVIRSLREELKLIFDAKRLAKLQENQAIKNEIAVLGKDFALPDRFTD